MTLISRNSKRRSPATSFRLRVSVTAVKSESVSLARACSPLLLDPIVFLDAGRDSAVVGIDDVVLGEESLPLSPPPSSFLALASFHFRVAPSNPSTSLRSVRARGSERWLDLRDETSSGTSSSLRYTSIRWRDMRAYKARFNQQGRRSTNTDKDVPPATTA